jgi:hypothetical protein
MRKRNRREGRILGGKVQERVGGSKLNSRKSEIPDVKVQPTMGLLLLGWNPQRGSFALVDWAEPWPKCWLLFFFFFFLFF